jgi:hypothetical protein
VKSDDKNTDPRRFTKTPSADAHGKRECFGIVSVDGEVLD